MLLETRPEGPAGDPRGRRVHDDARAGRRRRTAAPRSRPPELPGHLAGKTGTTDRYTDAWFIGYSPRITCGVWVGRDVKAPIGRKMSGAEAALPTWMRVHEPYLDVAGPTPCARRTSRCRPASRWSRWTTGPACARSRSAATTVILEALPEGRRAEECSARARTQIVALPWLAAARLLHLPAGRAAHHPRGDRGRGGKIAAPRRSATARSRRRPRATSRSSPHVPAATADTRRWCMLESAGGRPPVRPPVAIVIVALAFDFINGFHDAANSIATVVSTRVLSPGLAVVWAAFFNFVAAFVFPLEGRDDDRQGADRRPTAVTEYVILAGLVGAIVWDLITWYFGLPTSSSHALIGGFAGAAIAKVGFGAIVCSGWTKTARLDVRLAGDRPGARACC